MAWQYFSTFFEAFDAYSCIYQEYCILGELLLFKFLQYESDIICDLKMVFHSTFYGKQSG
jgi:hypothetical protein